MKSEIISLTTCADLKKKLLSFSLLLKIQLQDVIHSIARAYVFPASSLAPNRVSGLVVLHPASVSGFYPVAKYGKKLLIGIP